MHKLLTLAAYPQVAALARQVFCDPAKTEPTSSPHSRSFKSALFLFLLIPLTALGIFFRKTLSIDSWINVALLGAIPFAMGWAGVYLAANPPTSAKWKRIFASGFSVVFVIGVGLAAYQQKRAERALEVASRVHRHSISSIQRTSFESALRSRKDGSPHIQIACPASDEKDCAYAGHFVELFGEAGWDVAPDVQRLTLARAGDGISVVRQGGNRQYMMQHWDAGAYFPINEPHVMAIQDAFRALNIEIDAASDPDLPENVIRVYFGPEREDESAPTRLTRDRAWVERGGAQKGIPPPSQ